LYSGKEKCAHEAGVAFFVDKTIKRNILKFDPINERDCFLRLKIRFFNLSIINAYAPTEDKEELVKDEFYQNLEKAYDAAPSNDIKMVIGDVNARIGRDETYIGTVGNQSTS
jgi:exonuclease III